MAFRARAFKRLPYFPFYYNDWRSSPRVQAMTREQRALYLELLIEQWDQRLGSLPIDPATLAARLQLSGEAFAAHWPLLEPCFPPTRGGRRRNPKLAALRADIVQGACKSPRNRLMRQALPGTRSDPDQIRSDGRRRRRRDPYADYLTMCPHTPRCTKASTCGQLRELDTAVTEGRITATQAARITQRWRLVPGHED